MSNIDVNALSASAIRLLSAEAIQKAKSGHPGMPMGMADVGHTLFAQNLNVNPEDPTWINRDRFILSTGHGSMFLYSLLHLTGFGVTIDDIKSFRQWGSKTPGHPEFGHLDGVDTTTGPLGQGFTNGVGMSIAAKVIAEKFNTETEKVFGNHFVYSIVGDGCMMEGVTSEAASFAGHLGLGNYICFYDDNSITIEGETNLAFTEDVEARFKAYGWHTVKIDGHNFKEIQDAIDAGQAETSKPTLIIAKTKIGAGSPNKEGKAAAHGAPLGDDEIKLTKERLGYPVDKDFYVPQEVYDYYNKQMAAKKEVYNSWQEKYEAWRGNNPELAAEYDKFISREIPGNLEEELLTTVDDTPLATRALGGKVMQKIADLLPGYIGGSADLSPSTSTFLKAYDSIQKDSFSGKNFHYGVREHAMGSVVNGIALYGGFLPFGATFLVFSDYMRPPMRMAALMGLPVTYVLTHDSIFVGEDGPTHQPIENIASMRIIPNFRLFRPADAVETVAAWSFAVRDQRGPVALAMTRQNLNPLKRPDDFKIQDIYKGAYVVSKETTEKLEMVFVGTGSEVDELVKAKELLPNSDAIRVVSMPCVELYQEQSEEFKSLLVPTDAKVVVAEAGITSLWNGVFPKNDLIMVGIDHFGASAPYAVLADKFGLTGERIAEKVKQVTA